MSLIKEIAHVAIAVTDLDEAIAFYQDKLGLRLQYVEEVPSQKVRVAVFEVGGSHIELLEPISMDSPIARFLEKRGPGLHHLALSTDKLAERLKDLAASEVALIDKTPQPGAGGKEIAFVHPRSTGGVLLELCADKVSSLP